MGRHLIKSEFFVKAPGDAGEPFLRRWSVVEAVAYVLGLDPQTAELCWESNLRDEYGMDEVDYLDILFRMRQHMEDYNMFTAWFDQGTAYTWQLMEKKQFDQIDISDITPQFLVNKTYPGEMMLY